MKKLAFYLFIFIFLIMAFFNCGGSGEDNVNVTDKIFILDNPEHYYPGYEMAFTLIGVDSEEGEYTGSLSFNTKDKVIIDGVIAVPIDSLLILTNTVKGGTLNLLTIQYYNEDKELIMRTDNFTNQIYKPINSYPTVQTAKIGDFGSFNTSIASDGSIIFSKWELEKWSEEFAEYITMITTNDSLGNLISYQEVAEVIDEYGDRKSIHISWYFAEGDVALVIGGKRAY